MKKPKRRRIYLEACRVTSETHDQMTKLVKYLQHTDKTHKWTRSYLFLQAIEEFLEKHKGLAK